MRQARIGRGGAQRVRGRCRQRVAGNTAQCRRKGKLTIVDPGKDADITVTGEGTKKETGDRTVYEGFDGYARVSGPNIHVRIEGTDIDLEASGTGVAMLKGSGTYWTESMGQDDAKQWPVQGGRLTLKKA